MGKLLAWFRRPGAFQEGFAIYGAMSMAGMVLYLAYLLLVEAHR